MLKSLLALPLLCALFSPSLGAEPVLFDSDAFDRHFRQVLDSNQLPGGAYAIVRDGQIVRASGHGVRTIGGNEPVTDTTVFRIASVSKTFAAELTALLVKEGKLRWDDKVSAFVPQLQLKSTAHQQGLQIQHLLSQSTGFVSNAYDNLLDANVPLPKILPRFRELKPLCKPGQCYSYQNILFSLIEPAVERVTKQPYPQLVQQRLFQPLNMQQASIGLDAFLATANRAEPHIKKKGVWIPTKVQSGYYEVPPAAGVNASADDLGKWLIAQMGYNPDVVPPDVVAQLTEKRVRTVRDMRRKGWREHLTDAHYGLGWRIYEVGNEEIYLHAGWVKGYVAEVAYSKQRGTGLVVLLNAESSAINEITSAFWAGQLGKDVTPSRQLAE
ncbi:MAG: serine hydrolase domain-containing protein [Permianibacter sp.]